MWRLHCWLMHDITEAWRDDGTSNWYRTCLDCGWSWRVRRPKNKSGKRRA
jgi:hypothetical protein